MRKMKKVIVMGLIASFTIGLIGAMAVGKLTLTVDTGFLNYSAVATNDSCCAIGCIIYNKKQEVLASKENGLYSTNESRSVVVSYDGSGAKQAWAYAEDTNDESTYKYANY